MADKKRKEAYGVVEGVFATILMFVLSPVLVVMVGIFTPVLYVMTSVVFFIGVIGYIRKKSFLPNADDRVSMLPFFVGFAYVMPILGYIFAIEPLLRSFWIGFPLPGHDWTEMGFITAGALLLIFHFGFVSAALVVTRGRTTGKGLGEGIGNFGVFHVVYSIFITSHGFSILYFQYYFVLDGLAVNKVAEKVLAVFLLCATMPGFIVIAGLIQRSWYSLRMGRQISNLPSAPLHAAAAGLVDLTGRVSLKKIDGSLSCEGACSFHKNPDMRYFRLMDKTGEICVEMPEDLQDIGDDRFGIHYADNSGQGLMDMISHAEEVRVVGDFVPAVSRDCYGAVKHWNIPVERGLIAAITSKLFDGLLNPFGFGRPSGIFWVGQAEERPAIDRIYLHLKRHLYVTAFNMLGMALLLTKAISVLDK